jgi:hypothetical protein
MRHVLAGTVALTTLIFPLLAVAAYGATNSGSQMQQITEVNT